MQLEAPGILRVVALPWGYVFVDGHAHGRSPVDVRVPAGEHVVRVTGGVELLRRVRVESATVSPVLAEDD